MFGIRKFKPSVRARLIATFACVLFVPSLLISWYSYETAKTKVGDEMMRAAEANIRLMNYTIDQLVSAKKEDVEVLAKTIAPQTAGDDLGQFLRLHPEVDDVYYGTVQSMYLTTNDTGTSDAGAKDPRQAAWYQAAMKSAGVVVLGKPYLSKSSGDMDLPISRATSDGQGVVGIDLDLTVLQQMAGQVKIGTTGYPFILDKDGLFIVHPKEKLGTNGRIFPFVEKMYQGITGEFSYVYNGDAKRMAFTTNQTTGWKIGGTMYESDITSEAQEIQNKTLLVLGLGFLAGIVLVTLIIRSITRPLSLLSGASQKISEGDLTERIAYTAPDEFGRLAASFNEMADSLRQLIFGVSDSASQLASASQELNAGAQEMGAAAEHTTFLIQAMAEGTDQQVQSMEEAEQSVMQMSASVQQIAASGQSVSVAAGQAAVTADEGNRAIQQAVHQMHLISTSVNGSAESILELGSHAKHIGEIVATIRGIASQTNLLALNAAIEAARAGEHGRGFAVVADEVRKLAEQSSTSAQQIASYIATIQTGIEKAVQAMQAGTQDVSTGIEVVNAAGDAFAQIQQAVHEVAMQITGVSAAVVQMSAGTEQLAGTIGLITSVTESASANMQNVSASTEQQLASMQEITHSAAALSDLADQMEREVKRFKV